MITGRLWLAGLMTGFVAQPTISAAAAEPSQPALLSLKQGASQTLQDANITVTLIEVKDLTTAGCQGGPQGCPDYARITVSSPESTQEFKLYLAHTEAQHLHGEDQATMFGYRITLQRIKHDEATLVWDQLNR